MKRLAVPGGMRRPGGILFCHGLGIAILFAAALGPAGPARALEPDPVALSYYRACSDEAERHVLRTAEALACAEAYLAVKLSLLPGMTRARFDAMSPWERAAVNRVAYRAWRAWCAGEEAVGI